jgi:uncharacterized protein (DUF4213/DUF364 family)
MREIQDVFKKLLIRYKVPDDLVRIKVDPLSPEDAIGNPEHDDYPLLKGKERLMQAEYRGSQGVAFSDMFRNYEGHLSEITDMRLENNFRRAIFIATINALLRHLKVLNDTVHCKDEGPVECASQITDYIKKDFGQPKIAFIGYQPRMVENLARTFEIKVTDMDADNIGTKKNGVRIYSSSEEESIFNWADIVLATGTIFVNDTYHRFLKLTKPHIIYGVTGAGAAHLLGLRRYCPCGR